MLLVNSGGVITKMWTGEVRPENQDQVLSVWKKG